MDEAGSRVRLLIAPAGYGKTTLAREWLAQSGRGAAWITATQALADVASFALAVRNAIGAHFRDVGTALEEQLRLGPRSASKAREIAQYLADETAEWPRSLWLVVDDYHILMEVPAVEHFLDELVTSSTIQVIVASRHRPTWASARRLIYGDIHEIGQSALAMSHDEASEVLALAQKAQAFGLLALANGWPAIIGLAASADRLGIPNEGVPTTIYDFFAQELYQAAKPRVRRALVTLSFAPSITLPLAVHLVGDHARNAISEGQRLGLVQPDEGASYVMHSLVRDFLRRQTSDAGVESNTVVAQLAVHLLGDERLNDLFVLCREFPRSEATQNATESVLQMLLRSGGVSMMERWVAHALATGLDSPAVDLAQAELEFREGHYAQAGELALRSSRRLGTSSPLVSKALFRAGMSAYHENQPRQARGYHRMAREAAASTDDRFQALWGELNVVLETNEDPTDLLRALEGEASEAATHRLRLGNARLMAAYRRGGISEAVRHGEALVPLIDRVNDPMVVSAFLHALAHSSVLAGKYDDALSLVGDQLALIKKTRLNFVLPHALITKASASAGRRNFGEANRSLSQVEQLALEAHDPFILSSAAVGRIQTLLSQGDTRRAYEAAGSTAIERSLPALQGELLATRALAAAAAGRVDDAGASAAAAEHLAHSVEAKEFLAWAKCLRISEPRPVEVLAAQLRSCLSAGCVHAFVCAYRAAPAILGALAGYDDIRPELQAIVLRARDGVLGRRAGLDIPLARVADLSPRETEVFALLAEGLTNREIAKRLYISEVTAKVHVRRIFEKTGARSRAEAAVAAASYLSNSDE